MIRAFFVAILSLLSTLPASGQGVHWSWLERNQFNRPLNPAHNWQVSGSYRSQWAALGTPFVSQGLRIQKLTGSFAWGIDLQNNQATRQGYRETTVTPFASIQLFRNKNSSLYALAVGAILQKQLDFSELQFANQYVRGTGFDASVFNGEPVRSSGYTNFSLGSGLEYHRIISPLLAIQASYLLNQINRPVQDMTGNYRLPVSQQFRLQADVAINEQSYLHPSLFYSSKNPAGEWAGALHWKRELAPGQFLFAGPAYRISDAWLLSVGYEQPKWSVRAVYDHSQQTFNSENQQFRAWEMHFSFRFGARKNNREKPVAESAKSVPFKPDTAAVQSVPVLDRDEDGVPDADDRCPMVAGKPEREGCPEPKNKSNNSTGITAKPEADRPLTRAEFLSEAVAAPLEQTMNYGNVEFDVNSSEVRPRYRVMLQELAEYLQLFPKRKVLVDGHTDKDGSSLYNEKLGDMRAHAVRAELMKYGVSMESILVFTYGETRPVGENETEKGKARNRRVELIIVE